MISLNCTVSVSRVPMCCMACISSTRAMRVRAGIITGLHLQSFDLFVHGSEKYISDQVYGTVPPDYPTPSSSTSSGQSATPSSQTMAWGDAIDSSVPLSPNRVRVGHSQDLLDEGSLFHVSPVSLGFLADHHEILRRLLRRGCCCRR